MLKTLTQLQTELKTLVSKRTKAMLKIPNASDFKEQMELNEEGRGLSKQIKAIENQIQSWNYKTTGWFEKRNKWLNY